ncbi:MAG: hypothetical protein LRY68_08410, partial [Sulfurospirillum sp.]|nr:hypothetical protein [Sulfurospirillum sp.]
KKLNKIKKEREEKEREKNTLSRRRKNHEKRKKSTKKKVRLASMSPFQILVENIIQEGKKQSMSEIASLVKALTVDNAFENDKCEAAHYIKVKMEAAKGEWLPDGNPAKDKATKRTHAVMKILEECKKNVKEIFKVKEKLKSPKFRAFKTETLLKINVKENLKIQNIDF